jgi:hypothetical protein
MSDVEIKVEGAEQIIKRFAQMAQKDVGVITKKALKSGGKITLEKTKENANTMVGGEMGKTLSRYLGLRFMARMYRGFYGIKCEISNRANDIFVYTSKKGNRSYIPTAIEYGHAGPNTTTGKRTAKHIREIAKQKVAAPIPFMRHAADETKKQAQRKAIEIIKSELEKIWGK